MKKLKLSFLTVVTAILISGLLGCTSTQKVENPSPSSNMLKPGEQTDAVSKANIPSASPDMVKPQQTDIVNNKPTNTTTPVPETTPKIMYNENLCTDDEEVLFSFKIENSAKILSICLSKKQPDYIVYRFGTKEKIELEFPEIKSDSWTKFTYSYYLRGGGKENGGMDMNYLSFENGGYEYQIYQEYTAKDELTKVGVKIKEKSTNKETDIKGLSNTKIGSLINLRGNNKIKIENL